MQKIMYTNYVNFVLSLQPSPSTCWPTPRTYSGGVSTPAEETDAVDEISNLTREPANQGDRERAQNLYVWRMHFVLQILSDPLQELAGRIK